MFDCFSLDLMNLRLTHYIIFCKIFNSWKYRISTFLEIFAILVDDVHSMQSKPGLFGNNNWFVFFLKFISTNITPCNLRCAPLLISFSIQWLLRAVVGHYRFCKHFIIYRSICIWHGFHATIFRDMYSCPRQVIMYLCFFINAYVYCYLCAIFN